MAETVSPHPLEVRTAARELGINLRVARKRRRMLQSELAQKAGVSEKTLRRLEKGDDGVSVGNVLSVLWALGLLPTSRALANPDADEHGKTLELARLPERVRQSAPDNDF
jgi:DNA-binding XRE family transcriptional regulator